MLHVDNIHWLAFTNVDAARGVVSDDTVYIYDSLIPTKVNLNTKKQVCSLLKPKMGQEITFDLVDVMPQPNLRDCGLFALANITEIAYGGVPAGCQWDTSKMRAHLLACFGERRMNRFPCVRIRRKRKRFQLPPRPDKIYCICCMPNDKSIPM